MASGRIVTKSVWAAGVVCIVVFGALALTAQASGGPNLVRNGDFEIPVVGQPWISLVSGPSSLSGWTVIGNGVELMHSYWQPESGQQSLNLSSTGSAAEVSQQIATSSGATYVISWYLSANPGCTTPVVRGVNVLWNGGVVGSPTFSVSGHSFQSMGWTAESITVTASGATSTVAFQRATATDGSCGIAIDNVTVQAAQTKPGATAGRASAGGLVMRSTLTSALATPGDAFSSPSKLLVNALFTAIAILLITFPAQLFNNTFHENYDEIVAFWERQVGWLKRIRDRIQSTGGRRARVVAAALVILVGALFGGLLDPSFGLNGSSATTYLSTILSTVWGIAVGTGVVYGYRRLRHRETEWQLRAIPAGLVVAAICVLVSRLSDFQPGYLYGVVCGAAFAASLAKAEQGHAVALSTVVTVILAFVAWFAWVPVNSAAAQPDTSWPVVELDDFLGAVFTGGLIGATIGMVPLQFLPGGTLAAWHRGVWAVVSGLVTFAFVDIMLNPGRGGHPGHASLATILALFVFFGGGSVLFAVYFDRRRRKLAGASS